MLKALKAKAVTAARRLPKFESARRFARNQDAVVAVEFAFIAAPFLGLLFAILQTALVFLAGQTLEAGVSYAARLVMTGQAQKAGLSQEAFKEAICSQTFLFDCMGGTFVSVQKYDNFAATNTTPPIEDGKLKTDAMPYIIGGPGDIIVVQAYYVWPIYVTLLNNSLRDLGTSRLLVATAAFRNEPYN